MAGGHCGHLLEVDLTHGTASRQALPAPEELSMWIGGTGLALHLLWQRLRPGMVAHDADSPVILMTGPLTGTKVPNSSDWVVVCLNGQIPYAPCVSHIHGFFGARLKHAGYDGIVFTGKSPKPVLLWIDDDKVELRDASRYWGMDTFETQEKIQSDLGDRENISVACIGPAGEQMLRGGTVRCDMAYSAAKGGPGGIWGSKNLKAVAVRGTHAVPIHDPERFMRAADELRRRGEGKRPEAEVIPIQPLIAEEGAMAAMNFRDTEWPIRWAKRWREDAKKWQTKGVGSWECLFKCHHETLITTGPYAGTRVTGYGAGVIEEAATIIGVEDPGTGMFMAAFYDAMGCDPSEEGRLIAMAFELYNEGLLTKEQTGGLELKWGDDEAARELFLQILNRQAPLGSILAKGYREAVKELPAAEGRFVHIKGSGFMHDQRGYGLGILFQSIVSGAGPTWQGFGVEKWAEYDLGYTQPADRKAIDGKAEACFKTQCLKMVEDSIGLCWFLVIKEKTPGITRVLAEALSAATGWDFDWERARTVGERIVQMQRMIAVSRGFRKENDFEVSDRVLQAPATGPTAGRELKPHLQRMIDEYYALCGWDVATGAPRPETLARLGLRMDEAQAA
jgi:aldehyde:ferredoxin oxidoreductase